MLEAGLRERKKQRTREAIVTVALELFAERGYPRTTVNDIADAAEVSKATVFAYFPSKEEIVFADTAPLRAELVHELQHRSAGLSAQQTLRAFVAEYLLVPDERELLRERLIAENEQLRSHYRARLAEVEDAMAVAIAADLGEPADGLRPRLAAAAVLAALNVAKEHARRLNGRNDSRDEAIAVIDEALVFLDGGLAAISSNAVPSKSSAR
jgi:AcrR family transcriptional regulator